MTACGSVLQAGFCTDARSCGLCMRFCSAIQCHAMSAATSGLGRQADLRAVPAATHYWRTASTMRCR